MENPSEIEENIPIYLDFNATTFLEPEVIEEIHKSLLFDWGNPSSSHNLGIKAKSTIDKARDEVAKMISANSKDIIFTSGGTETNNLIINSAINFWAQSSEEIPHIISSNVEHDSIANVLHNLYQNKKIELSIVRVKLESGVIESQDLVKEIKPNTTLITIMHANNESGLIMPISTFGSQLKIINETRISQNLKKIYFHSDASQTIGKIPIDISTLGVDYLTIVGHKFYGPRIGALFAKNLEQGDTPVISMLFGGGQERGYRPGTENTPMIAGLGKAASLVSQNIYKYMENMKETRDYFGNKLLNIAKMKINFTQGEKLPNTLSICVPLEYTGAEVLEKCKGKICASLGAACHSKTGQTSKILIASGLSEEESRRTIRFSVGRCTTFKEIDMAVEILANAQSNIKKKYM